MRLKEMTAVVTGGASGMGEPMCYALAKEGATIIVVDRNLDGASIVVSNVVNEGGGSIINVCSIASYMGRPNRCAYVAAKSGRLGLTRTMAIDLAPKNIRVNGISPGMIASPFNQRFSESEETGSAWANDNLVGRWGNPDDMNGAVVFLASDESRDILRRILGI